MLPAAPPMLRELVAWGARVAAHTVRDLIAAEAAASAEVLASEGLRLSLVPPPTAVEVAALVASVARMLSPERAPVVAARLDAAGAPYTAELVLALASSWRASPGPGQ